MGNQQKWRSLIVDDNALMGSMLAHMLMQKGGDVTEVSSGKAALAELSAGKYDALWLDIRMQGISGVELCRMLRADPDFADLPIIAYTADREELGKSIMASAGFTDYLFKPVSLSALEQVLARLGGGAG